MTRGRSSKPSKIRDNSRDKAPGSVWILALFALPFAAAGLGILLLMVVPTLYDWGRMQSWQPVVAQVESATLQSHRSSKGGTSYSVSVRYTYQMGGVGYTGTRASISDRPDNIGSFHQQLGGRLLAAQRMGTPVQVWVNPQSPAESIADRSLRPGLLALALGLAVVSGGFGLLILAKIVRRVFRGSSDGTSHGTGNPDAQNDDPEPWLTQRAWADNSIRSDQRETLKTAWFMTLVWNAVAVPLMVLKLPGAWARGSFVSFGAMAFFGVLGACLLVWAVRATLDARRFGDARLVLDPFPGAIGGHFGATLALPVAYAPGLGFVIRLLCTRYEKGRSRGNDEDNEQELWRAEGMAQVQPQGTGVALSFRFDVPAHLPASQNPVAQEHHGWRVEVKSTTPGLTFARGFVVPVYATGATSGRLSADATQHPGLHALMSQELSDLASVRALPGGVELYFAAGRRWAASLMVLVFGAIFAGAGWFAGMKGAPMLFPIVFCGVGAAIVLGGLYELTNSLRVHIDRQGLWTERRVLGFVTARHQARAEEVVGLRLKEGGGTRSGSSSVPNYRLVAELQGGGRATLAEGVRGQAAAKQLMQTVQSRSGYTALDGP
ncbi:MAG: DUF3592 domain-containing protein [Acidovorax sp.]|nr:DUF3592 domain-containing protein [Acidovorax sp.]